MISLTSVDTVGLGAVSQADAQLRHTLLRLWRGGTAGGRLKRLACVSIRRVYDTEFDCFAGGKHDDLGGGRVSSCGLKLHDAFRKHEHVKARPPTFV